MKISDYRSRLYEVKMVLDQLDSIMNLEDYHDAADGDVLEVRKSFKAIYSRLVFLSGEGDEWFRQSSEVGDAEDTAEADTSFQISGLPGVEDICTANDDLPPVESSPNTKLGPRPTVESSQKAKLRLRPRPSPPVESYPNTRLPPRPRPRPRKKSKADSLSGGGQMKLRSSSHAGSPSLSDHSPDHSFFLRDGSPFSDALCGRISSPATSSLASIRYSLEDKHMRNVLPVDCDIIADARNLFIPEDWDTTGLGTFMDFTSLENLEKLHRLLKSVKAFEQGKERESLIKYTETCYVAMKQLIVLKNLFEA